jgi:hypothetical protein
MVLCAACAGAAPTTTSTAVVTTVAPPPTTLPTTSTTAPPPPCPPAPYQLGALPPTVVAAEDDTAGEPDEFTSIGGTHTRLWVNGDEDVAIALVRGALPPDQFPAERGEVDVAGSRGVAGPYPDGRWVIAWFNEPGDRCDQYTLVFYPPVSPAEVEATLAAMTRTPG